MIVCRMCRGGHGSLGWHGSGAEGTDYAWRNEATHGAYVNGCCRLQIWPCAVSPSESDMLIFAPTSSLITCSGPSPCPVLCRPRPPRRVCPKGATVSDNTGIGRQPSRKLRLANGGAMRHHAPSRWYRDRLRARTTKEGGDGTRYGGTARDRYSMRGCARRPPLPGPPGRPGSCGVQLRGPSVGRSALTGYRAPLRECHGRTFPTSANTDAACKVLHLAILQILNRNLHVDCMTHFASRG